MKAIHNFDPIYDANAQVLILGTMPSIISRENKFYYAHPQNRFWKIMEKLFLVQLQTIEDKKNFLLDYHIALWDVISSCDIEGSSDASIKNIIPNDISLILDNAPIKCIFCTGKKSYQLFKKFFHPTCPVICLPSPSSANASISLESLVKEYQQILDYLPKKR